MGKRRGWGWSQRHELARGGVTDDDDDGGDDDGRRRIRATKVGGGGHERWMRKPIHKKTSSKESGGSLGRRHGTVVLVVWGSTIVRGAHLPVSGLATSLLPAVVIAAVR